MRNKILIILLVLSNYGALSQTRSYLTKFNSVLGAEYSIGYSKKRIDSKSKRNNAHHFLEIGYFINANNLLGNKDISYKIIQNIIRSSTKKNGEYTWIVTDISPNDRNFSQKGKEFMLFEGYMFRYIAEFQYLYPEKVLDNPTFVKDIFFKWYERSKRSHKDVSSLFGLRLHIGSHWATVASYLTKLDPENASLYNAVLSEFDSQLRKSLELLKINGEECYIWNSTYPDKFVNNLRKRNIKPQVQDVSHGNHIIQYVLDSYSLGLGTWGKKDLERFRNTLKYIIWRNKEKPSDFVDGTFSNGSHTGWKQSDGWMKLMVFFNDKELYNIYNNYYSRNSEKISKHFPDIQYFAEMAQFEKNAR